MSGAVLKQLVGRLGKLQPEPGGGWKRPDCIFCGSGTLDLRALGWFTLILLGAYTAVNIFIYRQTKRALRETRRANEIAVKNARADLRAYDQLCVYGL
jgi:hypothetical protein